VSDQAKFEVQMLHDRVMIKVEKESGERRSTGGIVIPATVEQSNRLSWGEVCGVGHHARTVKVGDRVLFHPEDQYVVEIQGEDYLVMRERDLHAIASERPEHGTGLYL
jgi:chaperonin GroES